MSVGFEGIKIEFNNKQTKYLQLHGSIQIGILIIGYFYFIKCKLKHKVQDIRKKSPNKYIF